MSGRQRPLIFVFGHRALFRDVIGLALVELGYPVAFDRHVTPCHSRPTVAVLVEPDPEDWVRAHLLECPAVLVTADERERALAQAVLHCAHAALGRNAHLDDLVRAVTEATARDGRVGAAELGQMINGTRAARLASREDSRRDVVTRPVKRASAS